MMRTPSKLVKTDDGWALDSGWSVRTLSSASWPLHLARGDVWKLATVGPTVYWDGEYAGKYYRGPAIVRRGKTNAMFEVPNARAGEWAAYSHADDDNWTLEPGQLAFEVPGPLYSAYPLRPQGKCICKFYREVQVSDTMLKEIDMGAVAFDIGHWPFKRSEWTDEGGVIRISDELIHFLDSDRTRAMFGKLDEIVFFWFC